VGLGDGDGEGVGEGEGVLFFGFFGAFFLIGAGSDPDGANDTTWPACATWTGVTADGAAVFVDPEPAFPIPNAAPNATTAAIAPMAARRPGVIRGTSRASWGSTSPDWCT
jgi:hypothetical protein